MASILIKYIYLITYNHETNTNDTNNEKKGETSLKGKIQNQDTNTKENNYK